MTRLLFTLAILKAAAESGAQPQPPHYGDLATLRFKDWRAFQKPKLAGGVYDYRAAGHAKAELARYQQRLKAIDTTGWLLCHAKSTIRSFAPR
jgi:hypothetical protein